MDALHPNLARIAARYDEIIKLYNNRQLTGSQARLMIEKLAARDDIGVEWSVNPDNGSWQYRTKDGVLLEGTPPTWGLPSLTPKDLGSGDKDFDEAVTLYEVDSSPRGSLLNSTRGDSNSESPSFFKRNSVALIVSVCVLTGFVILYVLI